jgi:hypothetical protein
MKRMKCIGAQSVALTELTTPRPGVEMECRRDSGDGQHHTFVTAHPLDDEAALSALQLSLFEEPVTDAL